ncbi:polysaccharide deacetylase family protein, partial [Sulfurirhabdus autotrophica]
KFSLKYFLSPFIKYFLIVITAALALPGAAAADINPGRVFLTFDDGPINITLDLLDVLKAQGIKATFFINAIHLEGRGGEMEDQSRLALRRIIAEGHVLGNHSHDHMGHNRPDVVYSITASQAYSDIESDINYFVPGNIISVNKALGPLATRVNNQINLMARLPYANVWVHPLLGDICHWCGVRKGPFWHPDARANAGQEVSFAGGQLATLLYDRYQIISYGWDIQWMPSDWGLPTTNETMPSAEVIEEKIITLFNEDKNCKDMAPCKRPVRRHNVVVLTHDFLFENGFRGRGNDVNMPQLIKLIESLKAKGYIFETLDHYLD